MQATE
jgi:hypothetical protein